MLKGIGEKTEINLWRKGITDWLSFLETERVKGISEGRKRYFDALLRHAEHRLHEPEFLASFFPPALHWRLYRHLMENTVYLDIETSGLSFYSEITVLGVYRAAEGRYISLVQGFNLNHRTVKEALRDASIFVTFNGSSFDIPFIRRHFPFTLPAVPHLDLRFASRKLGCTGGLKSIEKEFGIGRDYEVETLTGEDALLYWRMWKKDGNRKALEVLKSYNRADVENLVPLADKVYALLAERTLKRAKGEGKEGGDGWKIADEKKNVMRSER